jgi:hypothetical protein
MRSTPERPLYSGLPRRTGRTRPTRTPQTPPPVSLSPSPSIPQKKPQTLTRIVLLRTSEIPGRPSRWSRQKVRFAALPLSVRRLPGGRSCPATLSVVHSAQGNKGHKTHLAFIRLNAERVGARRWPGSHEDRGSGARRIRAELDPRCGTQSRCRTDEEQRAEWCVRR